MYSTRFPQTEIFCLDRENKYCEASGTSYPILADFLLPFFWEKVGITVIFLLSLSIPEWKVICKMQCVRLPRYALVVWVIPRVRLEGSRSSSRSSSLHLLTSISFWLVFGANLEEWWEGCLGLCFHDGVDDQEDKELGTARLPKWKQ